MTDGGSGLRCLDCDERFEFGTATHRCPDCRGILDPTYDEETLAAFHDRLFGGRGAGDGIPDGDGGRTDAGLGRFAPVLPFDREQLVTLDEGGTSLVECHDVGDEADVDVFLKDEGRNGTGGIQDREMALAVTAARVHGASDVALPTTGNGGQAAAAYAGRAGLVSHSFVPSRTTFATKAMINVHGGDMNVVGGRYPDAREAFEEVIDDEAWHSLAPFETPYRHEACKTLAYELVASLGAPPDAVVHPTGHGHGLVGLDKGFRELARTGAIDRRPRLYAAQPAGCAPLVAAWKNGEDTPQPVDHPDTICGALEIPAPAGGSLALDALDATDGGAVETTDEELLDWAVSLAETGVPTSATGGVGVGGGHKLAERGAFDAGETVVIVNPATANREADMLRSHLMRQGV